MATRNHTALFKRYRDAVRDVRPRSSRDPGGSTELTEMFGGRKGYSKLRTDGDSDLGRAGAVSVSLPPAWVDISDEVSSDMSIVKTKIADLAKSHGRALMVSFDDNNGEQRTIEVLTAEITRSLKSCEQKLQRLSGDSGMSGDENIRKNVQRYLATDLQELSMEFRKLQKGYLRKLRMQNEGQSGADLGMGFGQQRSKADEDYFEDAGFSSAQTNQLIQNEAVSEEREREIIQIVESVNSLAQIMKDLSVLIIDQGTIVDRIDYNITNVSASVEAGTRELVKAEQTQRKGSNVLCIMILIALCLLMLVIYLAKLFISVAI